jgi:carbamate kinase
MGPKAEAAARFVEGGGQLAALCALDDAMQALVGNAGTLVTAKTFGKKIAAPAAA